MYFGNINDLMKIAQAKEAKRMAEKAVLAI